MASAVKRAGKKMIAYPEDGVSVISTTVYLKDHIRDPKQTVSQPIPACSPHPHRPCRSSTISPAYSPSSAGLLDIVCPHSRLIRVLITIPLLDVGWLTGDLIAGLTVGIVLVPQGMSYAQVLVVSPITPPFSLNLSAPACNAGPSIWLIFFLCRRLDILCRHATSYLSIHSYYPPPSSLPHQRTCPSVQSPSCRLLPLKSSLQ